MAKIPVSVSIKIQDRTCPWCESALRIIKHASINEDVAAVLVCDNCYYRRCIDKHRDPDEYDKEAPK